MPFLANRFGLAAAVASVLGLVIVALLLQRAGLRAELADERHQVAILQAAIQEQNAAVIRMQEAGARDQAARATRALRVLAPRQRANPKSVQELNTWLASP